MWKLLPLALVLSGASACDLAYTIRRYTENSCVHTFRDLQDPTTDTLDWELHFNAASISSGTHQLQTDQSLSAIVSEINSERCAQRILELRDSTGVLEWTRDVILFNLPQCTTGIGGLELVLHCLDNTFSSHSAADEYQCLNSAQDTSSSNPGQNPSGNDRGRGRGRPNRGNREALLSMLDQCDESTPREQPQYNLTVVRSTLSRRMNQGRMGTGRDSQSSEVGNALQTVDPLTYLNVLEEADFGVPENNTILMSAHSDNNRCSVTRFLTPEELDNRLDPHFVNECWTRRSRGRGRGPARDADECEFHATMEFILFRGQAIQQRINAIMARRRQFGDRARTACSSARVLVGESVEMFVDALRQLNATDLACGRFGRAVCSCGRWGRTLMSGNNSLNNLGRLCESLAGGNETECVVEFTATSDDRRRLQGTTLTRENLESVAQPIEDATPEVDAGIAETENIASAVEGDDEGGPGSEPGPGDGGNTTTTTPSPTKEPAPASATDDPLFLPLVIGGSVAGLALIGAVAFLLCCRNSDPHKPTAIPTDTSIDSDFGDDFKP